MNCIARVPMGGRSVSMRSCLRAACVGGYCTQHNPENVARKAEERSAKWDAAQKERVKKFSCLPCAIALLKRAQAQLRVDSKLNKDVEKFLREVSNG
jgi:hypothetical protein